MSSETSKPVYAVACPKCQSKPGELCVVDPAVPHPRSFPHQERIEVAKKRSGLRQVT